MRLGLLLVVVVTTVQATVSRQSSRDLLLDPDHPDWQQPAPAVSTIVFETSKGRIVFEMRREWAPHGADRFYNLVRHGFYDGGPLFPRAPGNVDPVRDSRRSGDRATLAHPDHP